MRRTRSVSLAVGSLLLILSPSSIRADDKDIKIFSPDHRFKGLTQADLANDWWRWALSFPAPVNPLLDTTGEFSHLGDLGPVFFLAATTGDQTVARTVTIGSDQAVFFPVFPFITWDAISAYHPGTYPNLLRDVEETAGIEPSGAAPNTKLTLTLNGKPLPLPKGTTSLFDFRQTSPELFNLFIPANNAFFLTDPIYPGTFPSVSDGWWVLLKPLPVGRYTLRFGGDTIGIGPYAANGLLFTDTTYTIVVRDRSGDRGHSSAKAKARSRATPPAR
jgi:hypothetical protein